jgi:endonuclease/exonuclease/phosphatase family metal-dependent hydrolase
MRLLSYNIHKGIGGRDRRYRLRRIIEVVRRHEPDLMCLQEVDRHVDRSRFDDQPHILARELGAASSLYQTNVKVRTGGYGNLILSRWPISKSHQVSLRLGWRKSRGAQIAVVETPRGPLQLVNWHLGLREAERHWQVDHLLRHHLFRESAHLPSLVVGDTNDWRDTLRRGPFAHHEFHAATAPPSRFRSFPAAMPVASLDKIFYKGAIHMGRARIVRTQLAREASDHLPLILDFQLKSDVPTTP